MVTVVGVCAAQLLTLYKKELHRGDRGGNNVEGARWLCSNAGGVWLVVLQVVCRCILLPQPPRSRPPLTVSVWRGRRAAWWRQPRSPHPPCTQQPHAPPSMTSHVTYIIVRLTRNIFIYLESANQHPRLEIIPAPHITSLWNQIRLTIINLVFI